MHKLNRLKLRLRPHHVHNIEVLGSVFLCLVVFTSQVSAVTRFQERSLEVFNTQPGATTSYKVSFKFATSTAVGSIGMRFCIDPIPYMPCDVPTGLSASQAVLAEQTGETGFNIASQGSNEILLSRSSPQIVSNGMNSYTFSGVVNPTDMSHSYAIRLTNYASVDGTGPTIDVGSVLTQVSGGIELETQVPPMLIFCLGQQVDQDCLSTEGGNYSDMGTLSSRDTLTAQSQMALGTNATAGFVVTVNGGTMAAGTKVIDAIPLPTVSTPGTSQFGINLVANSLPGVGSDPDGPWVNATPAVNYAQPNRFMYKDGDVVASSPNVSLMRRFTVSYIVNANSNLPAGVYTTTLTYIASGRF